VAQERFLEGGWGCSKQNFIIFVSLVESKIAERVQCALSKQAVRERELTHFQVESEWLWESTGIRERELCARRFLENCHKKNTSIN